MKYWLGFLDRVTDGDRDLIDYLQRVCGYCLTGSVREHVMFFLYGGGANGKSVFINTFAGVMGTYAITAPLDMFLESRNERHPTELARLRGARLVTATETDEGRSWAEAKIKAMTGGDTITARFMRQDFFEFKPQFKIMIAGNHKPQLKNVGEAMRRRLHLIPFTLQIPANERDKDLTEKLKEDWKDILHWAIKGVKIWFREGLQPPEAVVNATNDYLTSEDALGTWLAEECFVDKQYETTLAILYEGYAKWCDQSNERKTTRRAFSNELDERGFAKTRTSSNVTAFVGLSPKGSHPSDTFA